MFENAEKARIGTLAVFYGFLRLIAYFEFHCRIGIYCIDIIDSFNDIINFIIDIIKSINDIICFIIEILFSLVDYRSGSEINRVDPSNIY
jgi:phage-related protein